MIIDSPRSFPMGAKGFAREDHCQGSALAEQATLPGGEHAGEIGPRGPVDGDGAPWRGAGGQGSVGANAGGARTSTKPLAGPVRVKSKVFAVGCVEPPASEVVEGGPLVIRAGPAPTGRTAAQCPSCHWLRRSSTLISAALYGKSG